MPRGAGAAGLSEGSTREELLDWILKHAQDSAGALEDKEVEGRRQGCEVCKDKAHSRVCRVTSCWNTPGSDPTAGPGHSRGEPWASDHGLIPPGYVVVLVS